MKLKFPFFEKAKQQMVNAHRVELSNEELKVFRDFALVASKVSSSVYMEKQFVFFGKKDNVFLCCASVTISKFPVDNSGKAFVYSVDYESASGEKERKFFKFKN